MTNGSAEGVAKPALTAGGAIQLLKGPLLDINMAQVLPYYDRSEVEDFVVETSNKTCHSDSSDAAVEIGLWV
jgi:hypothetical protein